MKPQIWVGIDTQEGLTCNPQTRMRGLLHSNKPVKSMKVEPSDMDPNEKGS